MKYRAPRRKKEPYTGDPNATLTICYTKRRRHLSQDLLYVCVPKQPEGDADPEKPRVVVSLLPVGEVVGYMCRHCGQDPVVAPAQAS